ncbi:MAG: FkbM family methyltransferase [Ferruginibacter sp.]
MFSPVSFGGKLFKRYLLAFDHPGKVRIQNLIGRFFFSHGIYLDNLEGTMFRLDPNDWITRILLKEGVYEEGSISLAKKILNEGGIFIDIGANFGLFTCLAANDNKNIKVVAIDPNYKIIGWLLNNIALNNLQERVAVYNMAVSQKFQVLSLQQPAADNMGTTITGATSPGALSVLSCPLDFLYKGHGDLPIDLLKIDVEGNEFDILENFPFDKCIIRNIILEFNHLCKVGFAELLDFFEKNGFKSFTVNGDILNTEKQGIPENNIWFVNQLTTPVKP